MIDIEQINDTLRVSYYGKDGKVAFKDIAIPKTEKYKWELAGSERRDPYFMSWDGKPVKKTRANWLNRFRIDEFMTALGPEYLKEIYEFNAPETWFCDIEVEVEDDFPDPAIAATKVTTVALVNSRGATTVLGTKQMSTEQMLNVERRYREHLKDYDANASIEYIYFQSEHELLVTLFGKWFRNAPLITGWNFINFDWKFLVNRCKRLNIDVSTCSPSRQMKGDDMLPQHKIVVDYLDLYKKWDRVVKIKENFKLDTVGKAVLGIEKIKYSGTFMDLYNNDYETYVFYNAIDTYLVYQIDKKIKTLQTFLMLGNVTQVEAQKAFSPIWMTESIMVREFYKRKRIIAEVKKGSRSDSFEGAYVKDPKKGLFQHIATFDFASLYPSTMRQWNISPESYIGKGIDIPEGKNWIKTASGGVFDNSRDSLMKSMLTEYYALRKQAKGHAFSIEKEIDRLQQILKNK